MIYSLAPAPARNLWLCNYTVATIGQTHMRDSEQVADLMEY